MNVKLLLLDEPGAGLDCRSRKRLVQLLQSRGESMLLATHDLELARQLCDQVAILDEGRLVACGPARPILSDEGLLSEHGLV